MKNRRLFYIIFIGCFLCICAGEVKAQMTDDAVVAYIKEGVEKGKSQQVLVTELAAKGVTKAQAERIRRLYEDSQKQEMGGQKQQQQPLEKQRSHEWREEFTEEEMEMAALSLEPLIENAEDYSTQVFGRDIFVNKNLTFAPSAYIATPQNYRLGPGDEVIIDIWGVNQSTIRSVISPEGSINVQDVGMVYLNGKTVKEAEAYMRRQLGKIYSLNGEEARSEIKLTLGDIRTIQVHVMGEVNAPGTYFLSSMSNVYHALYRAGGFSPLGGLRQVKLIRQGKEIASIDIYDFLLKGKTSETVMLQEGDIIVVSPYDILVRVKGGVKRPMMYEMKKGETVEDLIRYAGGFSGDAYKDNLNLVRKNGKEYQVFTVNEPDYSTFRLVDGDEMEVGIVLDRYANRVEIQGAVYRPGFYQLGEEIKTVSQLVKKAEGIKGSAFTNRALLYREKEDLTMEVFSLDILAVLNGSASDVELFPNDMLYISSIRDLEDSGYVSVMGEVLRPGRLPFVSNMTLEDVILQVGGVLESASTARIDISRRVKNPSSLIPTDSLTRNFVFALKDGLVVDGEKEFVLEKYDRVYVRKSPGYGEQIYVKVLGEVLFEGEYALSKKNQRVSDLLNSAGGVTDWAYLKGARLLRKISEEEKFTLQTASEVLLAQKDTNTEDKLKVKEVYYVGLDLEEALANPGSDADLVLRENDVLFVPEYTNTVKISGCVMYSNTVVYNPQMKVKDFVEMAGGYGFRAKRSKAYIVYMNGMVAKASSTKKGMVQPGCEIIVPERKQSNGDILQSILSVATTSASLATMVATIGNIIKK